jgi:hypothetical protein
MAIQKGRRKSAFLLHGFGDTVLLVPAVKNISRRLERCWTGRIEGAVGRWDLRTCVHLRWG